MEFIEASAFTKYHSDYFHDDDLKELQRILWFNPEAGAIMQGTGGFRKMRWPDPRRGKGKRGGLRIIYYYFLEDQQIWLLSVYGKSEADDLSPDEKRALKKAIKIEKLARSEKRIKEHEKK